MRPQATQRGAGCSETFDSGPVKESLSEIGFRIRDRRHPYGSLESGIWNLKYGRLCGDFFTKSQNF